MMLSPTALFFFSLLLLTVSASATSSSSLLFCKCTCFTNSTIIPLPATSNCNDCNRQFCIDYNLPICKTAKEADVVTTCFRTPPSPRLSHAYMANGMAHAERDSVKDKVVVCVFIFATVGLLVWAGVRPWANRWVEKARQGMRGYQGVPAGEGAER